MRNRLRVLAIATTLAAGVLAGGASSASAFPIVGVNIAGVPTGAQIAQANTLGAKEVRMFVLWSDVEPHAGQLDANFVASYVGIVRQLNADGIGTDFVVVRTPSWESGSTDPAAPPKNPMDFADFLSQFAATPGLAGNHIAYELWNEEDAPVWWNPVNPAQYAAMVKAAAPALHAADPTAFVLTGPTTGNNYAFLQSLYQNGIGGLTDGVAVHTDNACLTEGPDFIYRDPAGNIGQFAFQGYQSVHQVMVNNGEGSHPIWMTEFGWNSSQTDQGGSACADGNGPSGVTPQQQATFITQSFHCMNSAPYLQDANWFTLDDDPTQPIDDIRHYGLFDPSGGMKPSWAAFQAVAKGGDQISGPCGDFTGPMINILTPKLGQKYATTLPISIQAIDAQGVHKLAVAADGKSIEGTTSSSLSFTWFGAKDLSLGNHTIQATASDDNGNVSTATVQVTKVSATSLVAVGPAHFGFQPVACTGDGTTCTLAGQGLTPAGGPLLSGKLQVQWQLLHKVVVKVKGKKTRVLKFTTQHRRSGHASKPFKFKQKLKPGKWRVRVVFLPPKPLKRTNSPWAYFTVTKHAVKKKHH